MNEIDFYYKEYSDKKWESFKRYVKKSNIKIKGVPQDIVDATYHALGEGTKEWLQRPLSVFGGKTAMELLKSDKGSKALKSFIMRLPC